MSQLNVYYDVIRFYSISWWTSILHLLWNRSLDMQVSNAQHICHASVMTTTQVMLWRSCTSPDMGVSLLKHVFDEAIWFRRSLETESGETPTSPSKTRFSLVVEWSETWIGAAVNLAVRDDAMKRIKRGYIIMITHRILGVVEHNNFANISPLIQLLLKANYINGYQLDTIYYHEVLTENLSLQAPKFKIDKTSCNWSIASYILLRL